LIANTTIPTITNAPAIIQINCSSSGEHSICSPVKISIHTGGGGQSIQSGGGISQELVIGFQTVIW